MGVNSSGPYRGFEKLLAYVKPGAINDQDTLNYQIARLEAVVREKDLPSDNILRKAFNKLWENIISS
jgi:hypothetical protein